MISRCCKAKIYVEGHTTHYYVCKSCGRACDPRPLMDWEAGYDAGRQDETQEFIDK